MSDKGSEGSNKMTSIDYVGEARGMAEFIVQREHRGPGDTIEAAMHRAERKYGVPAAWLHRLRYLEIRDIPASAFFAILNGCQAAESAGQRAYEAERKRAGAGNSILVRLAAAVAPSETER